MAVNNLCLLTNLSSSDLAAWAQAAVSSIAIVVGACFVVWQVRRGRMDLQEREAQSLDGLARLLVHLRDYAVEARLEKRKLHRWPPDHPAEPSLRFAELAEAVISYPLETVRGEVSFEALLNARRVAREVATLLDPLPELDVNPNLQSTFDAYMKILDDQIRLLRSEAGRLVRGQNTRYSVERRGQESA